MNFTSIIKYLASFAVRGQDVIKLSNILTQEEWDARQLNSQTMTALHLKGSPKLSKVLIHFGVSNERVSLALSVSKGLVNTKVECQDVRYLQDQGNSIHYSSCQATDSRSKWGRLDWEYNRVDEDKGYWGTSLFLWYTGNPMFIDGLGYTSRAKLRVVYNRDTNQVAGLYVEQIYGSYSLLMDNIKELKEWWDNYSSEKGWQKTPLLKKLSYEEQALEGDLYAPSHQGGYQDTLYGDSRFAVLEVNSAKSLMVQSHQMRKGLVPHSHTVFNPQKNGCTSTSQKKSLGGG